MADGAPTWVVVICAAVPAVLLLSLLLTFWWDARETRRIVEGRDRG